MNKYLKKIIIEYYEIKHPFEDELLRKTYWIDWTINYIRPHSRNNYMIVKSWDKTFHITNNFNKELKHSRYNDNCISF